MELERLTALAASVDSAQHRERESIRNSRELVLRNITEASPTADQLQLRTSEWRNAEAATWRDRQLEPLAQATAQRVAEGHEAFFERRKERRQLQTILDAEHARARHEQERRTQREIDDWFSNKWNRQRKQTEF